MEWNWKILPYRLNSHMQTCMPLRPGLTEDFIQSLNDLRTKLNAANKYVGKQVDSSLTQMQKKIFICFVWCLMAAYNHLVLKRHDRVGAMSGII